MIIHRHFLEKYPYLCTPSFKNTWKNGNIIDYSDYRSRGNGSDDDAKAGGGL